MKFLQKRVLEKYLLKNQTFGIIIAKHRDINFKNKII